MCLNFVLYADVFFGQKSEDLLQKMMSYKKKGLTGHELSELPEIDQGCTSKLRLKSEFRRSELKRVLEQKKNPFRCSHYKCGRKFKSEYLLLSHKFCEHPQSNDTFTCEFDSCNTTFFDKQSFKDHQKKFHKSGSLKCIECNKCFHKKSILDEHVIKVHDKPIEKKFACPDCNIKFYTRCHMRLHSRSHNKKVQ